jgi:hypothetical protein
LLLAGVWHVRLYYNILAVVQYNAQMRALLQGSEQLLLLVARFRPTPSQQGMLQGALQQVATLEQTAAESMMHRLHQDQPDDVTSNGFWSTTMQGQVAMRFKEGMPVFMAERAAAPKVCWLCDRLSLQGGGADTCWWLWLTDFLAAALQQQGS